MAALVCLPWLAERLSLFEWHVTGSISLDFGGLFLLPAAMLTALFAPRVAYRRRDALMMFFPPWSIRFAWVIGTRLGQLPHRDWPERTDAFPVHGRYTARIAIAAHRYRRRRLRRAAIAEQLSQPAAESEALTKGYDHNAPS
jgi:hypothetical protein